MPISGIIPPAGSSSAPSLTPVVPVVEPEETPALIPVVAAGGESSPAPLAPAAPTPVVYPPGPVGPAGASAYEVAVENGFEGDEAAWLASLSGGTTIPILEFPPQNAATPEGWHVLAGMTLYGNFVQGLPVVLEQVSPTEAYSGNWAYMDNEMESVLYFEEIAVGNTGAGLPSGSLTSSGNGYDSIFVQFHEALPATTGQFAIYQARLYINRGTDAAPDWHMEGTNLVLANGSRVVSSGSSGMDIICSANYTLRWQNGQLYYLDYSGVIIKCEMMVSQPSAYDDVAHGFTVGSLWEMTDGSLYKCTLEAASIAEWVMVADSHELQNYRIGAAELEIYETQISLGALASDVSSLNTVVNTLSMLNVDVDLYSVSIVTPSQGHSYNYICNGSGLFEVDCGADYWADSPIGASILVTSYGAISVNFLGLSTYLTDATGLSGSFMIDNSSVFGFRLLKVANAKFILTKL